MSYGISANESVRLDPADITANYKVNKVKDDGTLDGETDVM